MSQRVSMTTLLKKRAIIWGHFVKMNLCLFIQLCFGHEWTQQCNNHKRQACFWCNGVPVLLLYSLQIILKISCSHKEKKQESQLMNKCTSYLPLRQSAESTSTLYCFNYNNYDISYVLFTGLFNNYYQMIDSFKSYLWSCQQNCLPLVWHNMILWRIIQFQYLLWMRYQMSKSSNLSLQ